MSHLKRRASRRGTVFKHSWFIVLPTLLETSFLWPSTDLQENCLQTQQLVNWILIPPSWGEFFDLWTFSSVELFSQASGMALWMAMSVSFRLVSLPLWLKYLKKYWMDCHYILYTHAWSPEDESLSLWWSFFVCFQRDITVKLGTDICVALKVNCHNLVDLLLLHLVLLSRQNFNLSNILVCD